MGKYISFGSINKNYGFIIITVLFKMITKIIIFGLNYNNSFVELNLYNLLNTDKLSEHKLIHQTICYIGTIFFGWILYKFGTETKVYDNAGEETQKKRKKHSIYILFPIVILWVIEELLLYLYNDALIDLDFWMIELFFVILLSEKYFYEIYKHQKLAIYINLSLCILKIVSICLSLYDKDTGEDHKGSTHFEILYMAKKVLIPIGIIVYIFLISIRAFVNIKIKSLIEHENQQLQYISPSEVLMIYGAFGAIICLIICIFTSIFKCTENQDLKNYFCKVTFNETNIEGNYFDNFDIYTTKLTHFCNLKEVLIEILIIILGSLSFSLYKYFFILVIKYLSPVHATFSFSIYYLLQKIILPINTAIQKGTFINMNHHVEYIEEKYILEVIGDIIALFGFMIYLEIIQLNFCGLNENLRDSIIKRGNNDIKCPMNDTTVL